METNNNYPGPDEEWEDPANQDDFPETDDLENNEDDDQDIDIDNDDSEEIPDGDDVDLDRAE